MRIIATAAVLAIVTACTPVQNAQQRSVQIPSIDLEQNSRLDVDEAWYGEDYQMASLSSASMKGELPQVGSFDDTEGYGFISMDHWGDASTLDLQINTLSEDGWGMVGIYLNIDDDGVGTYTTDDIVGCSGPDEGMAEFDEAPDDAELIVEEVEIDGEDFVQFELVGDFRGENTVIGVAVVPAGDE